MICPPELIYYDFDCVLGLLDAFLGVFGKFFLIFLTRVLLVKHLKFNRIIKIIKIMVKKEIDERICRDCGRPIIGRRIDAIICKDCRRKAQEESSQRIKEMEKEERILKKVEGTSVKREIERKKVQEILKELEKGDPDDPNKKRNEFLYSFGIEPVKEYIHSFGGNFWKDMQSFEIKLFWEFINRKIEEKLEEEKRKKEAEEEEKKNKFGSFGISY